MAHSLVCQLPSDQESSSKETIVFNSLNMINYYSTLSKTDQIMSRYRPIAPKPQLSMDHHHNPTILQLDTTSTTPPQKPQRLRAHPHLQTRPPSSPRGCRKRTKVGFSPCNTKRSSSTTPLLLHATSSSAPHAVVAAAAAAAAASPSPSSSSTPAANTLNQSMQQGFARVHPQVAISLAGFDDGVPDKLTIASAALVTPPLLQHPPTAAAAGALLTRSLPTANHPYYFYSRSDDKVLDLNSPSTEFPQEDDLPDVLPCKIIAPLPVRPIGSSIHVVCINDNPSSTSSALPIISGPKRPEEVEEEVECELLPAVVSDSNNRVRLANSAYNEMVGQPECPWLDSTNISLGVSGGGGGGACKRIGGEVTLHLSDATLPSASNGFSCKVKIGWRGSNGKNSIYAPCDVTRLSCVSKDYLFTWRFHITEAFADTYG